MIPDDFIKKYEAALKSQDWKNVDPILHQNVCVTFSNGAVHNGKANVKSAFENNFTLIKSEDYSIQNVKWILKNESTAVFLFDYYWKGFINNQYMEGNGIGTSVLINENDNWVLLTENLSKKIA